jgi:hypothetical protein
MNSYITPMQPHASVSSCTGVTALMPAIHSVTQNAWLYDLTDVIPTTTVMTFTTASFRIAPNKVSPHDKIWQEIERLLANLDAIGANSNTDNDWLGDLRSGWDERLDDINEFRTWK